MGGFHGQEPRLFAKGKSRPLVMDEGDGRSRVRHGSWVGACKGGERSPGSFVNAAAITDTVNLGTVALRAGRKVLFDSEKMEVTNGPAANKYLRREYRKGWEL
jgi:hypothetical protein